MLIPYQTRTIETRENETPQFCASCSDLATIEAAYDLWGATVIQTYCNSCIIDKLREEGRGEEEGHHNNGHLITKEEIRSIPVMAASIAS
jgi:hypothetical protein